ncbi:hypothetical protein C7G75_19445, partial [Acinetobacter nosocomialis]
MRLGLLAKVEVRLELPVLGDGKELLEGGLDWGNGVHVLQVGAKALELQGSPDEDLVNAAGVLRPFGEHVGRGLVCLLGLLDGAAGLPEDDRTVGILESLESGVHGIPSTDALEDALGLL